MVSSFILYLVTAVGGQQMWSHLFGKCRHDHAHCPVESEGGLQRGHWQEQNLLGGNKTISCHHGCLCALLHLGVGQQEQHPGKRSSLRLPPHWHNLCQHLLQADHLPDVKHEERVALVHPGAAGSRHRLCHSSPRPDRQVRAGRPLWPHPICHPRPLPLWHLRCPPDV